MEPGFRECPKSRFYLIYRFEPVWRGAEAESWSKIDDSVWYHSKFEVDATKVRATKLKWERLG